MDPREKMAALRDTERLRREARQRRIRERFERLTVAEREVFMRQDAVESLPDDAA